MDSHRRPADDTDRCPALLVETKEWEKRFLLTFDEGNAKIYEEDLILTSDDEYSMGEKLEVVMEVISYMRKSKSTKDILNLTKKDFVDLMENIADLYPKSLINLMKRSSAGFIKSLSRKATADMAADELSQQLSLPLGGDYSFGEENKLDDLEVLVAPADIPSRTPWQIQADLEFINQALE